MRFMMIVKADEAYEKGAPPPPALQAAMGSLIEKEVRRGRLVEMGGLLPSSQGARVRVRKGKLTVVDGPFAEAKELIGGYAVFELPSKEEAVASAREFMQLHVDVLGPSYEGECEVRQLADAPPQGA